MHRTLAELAAEAAVSEPTVVRFCRAVGFRGFREFQITLAQALAAQGGFNDAAMTKIDPANLVGSVLNITLTPWSRCATASTPKR